MKWSIVFIASKRHSFTGKGFYAGEYVEPQGGDLNEKILYMIGEAIIKHKFNPNGGIVYYSWDKARLIEAQLL